MSLRAIHSGPVPQAEVIEDLRRLLELAETGQLQAFAYVGEHADTTIEWSYAGSGQWLNVAGRLQWLALHIVNEEEGWE